MGNLDRKLDRMLDATGGDQGEEGTNLDPSVLTAGELREVTELMRVAKGRPRLDPDRKAQAEAREAGRMSHVVPSKEMREDERAMERADFDLDRLSPEEQERLGELFEKMRPEG